MVERKFNIPNPSFTAIAGPPTQLCWLHEDGEPEHWVAASESLDYMLDSAQRNGVRVLRWWAMDEEVAR